MLSVSCYPTCPGALRRLDSLQGLQRAGPIVLPHTYPKKHGNLSESTYLSGWYIFWRQSQYLTSCSDSFLSFVDG